MNEGRGISGNWQISQGPVLLEPQKYFDVGKPMLSNEVKGILPLF